MKVNQHMEKRSQINPKSQINQKIKEWLHKCGKRSSITIF